ncbi:Alpha-1,2-mannosyltransferase [Podosphaera aphanis]|nr:Alpha-1,2-mannosyltransferase [Podosphaera aphanis]
MLIDDDHGIWQATPMMPSKISSQHSDRIRERPRNLKPSTPFAVKPTKAFYVFLIANTLAALFAPIQDCDETFNYWEPSHYITHGYGMQTWEYSPEYAIRSWLYISLHALVANFRRLFPGSTKIAEFYFVRYSLGLICSLCQTLMFRSINNIFNPRVALFFMMSMIFSPGMYHASASFLPSSFAMCTTMLGISAFMDWRTGIKTSQGIIWFSVGGIIGWPFSFILCLPFLLEEIILSYLSGREAIIGALARIRRGITASLFLVLLELSITSFFYKHLAIVPLNIVLYNVFSGSGRGPEIYGTEKWHFYIRNLLLNFNIWFVLAVLSLPIFMLQKLCASKRQTATSGLRSVIFMSPFYLWLTIFSFQPHKEERFMYPVYPCLALNAAMSLHMLLATLGNSDPGSFFGKIPSRIKLVMVMFSLISSIDLALLRIYGIYTAYSAPLQIYEPLSKLGSPNDAICFGKEWYRFPNSYHLPRNMRAKFIRSEFKGLLPGEFLETQSKFDFWSGAGVIPPNMNDQNLEDENKYTEISSCSFLVDTYYPERAPSSLEPNYLLDTETWEAAKCISFLDATKTPLLGRILWLPELPQWFPKIWQVIWRERTSRKWGKHCLLKRKRRNISSPNINVEIPAYSDLEL